MGFYLFCGVIFLLVCADTYVESGTRIAFLIKRNKAHFSARIEIMTKKYRQTYNLKSEHVPLLTHEEFLRLQIDEIRKYQQNWNIPEDKAAFEWITLHAKSLREEWSPFLLPKKELLEKAREEIARHRWIESEKHGQDLGVEAEIDWLEKHAESFKKFWCRKIQEGATN